MKEKTAVELLEEALIGHLDISERYKKELFKRAKEMEKEQIMDAYENGVKETNSRCEYQDGKQYYNETFKSE
jgi:hypothetical protein